MVRPRLSELSFDNFLLMYMKLRNRQRCKVSFTAQDILLQNDLQHKITEV